MLTGGHIAISYLLAEAAKTLGVPLSPTQTYELIVAGNIVDIDYLVGLMKGDSGEKHHRNITHTPLGAIIIWVILCVLVKPDLTFSWLILTSLFIHLALDDLGHWIYKSGLHKHPVGPQINWLYPYTKYSEHEMIEGNKEAVRVYVTKAWPVAILELLLIVTAVSVLLLKLN